MFALYPQQDLDGRSCSRCNLFTESCKGRALLASLLLVGAAALYIAYVRYGFGNVICQYRYRSCYSLDLAKKD